MFRFKLNRTHNVQNWGCNDDFFLEVIKSGVWSATKDGRIWSNNKNKFIYENLNTKKGYIVVEFTNKKGVTKYTFKHRFIYLYFKGKPKKPYYSINHKNGKKNDNAEENLEAGLHRYNIDHSFETGLQPPYKHGDEHHLVRISDDIVNQIRSRYDKALKEAKSRGKTRVVGTESTRGLARQFGISHSLSAMIVRNERRIK